VKEILKRRYQFHAFSHSVVHTGAWCLTLRRMVAG
jgi:hypothetical protein